MSASLQNTTLVELHVPDFALVKDFYAKLGFIVVRETKPKEKEGYLVLKKDNNILCFWPGNEYVNQQSYFKRFPKDTKRGYGVEIVIMVEDIEAFYEKVKQFAKVVDALQLRPWDVKDFRIEDPFGFYLRISQAYSVY